MAAYGAIVIVLVWYRLAETLPVRGSGGAAIPAPAAKLQRAAYRPSLRRDYRMHMLHPRRDVRLAVGQHPRVHRILGATPSLAGTFISVSLGGFILGSIVAGRISNRLGSTRLIRAGNLICLSSAALALVPAYTGVQSAPFTIAPVIAFMFGVCFVIPPGSAAAIAPFPSMAGAASSFLGSASSAPAQRSSRISGYLYDGRCDRSRSS